MNDLVNRIASGQATLLGIDEICVRLSVSRATFDRWVKNGSRSTNLLSSLAGPRGMGVGGGSSLFNAGSDNDSSMSFPPPDIRIGNSPKWEMETFKNWLRTNTRPGA
jgi:predicted DNA-binding transcriptional regulator AlpA